MFSQADLFKKAAECEQLTSAEASELRRSTYRLLRDIWLALAEEAAEMTPEALAGEVAAIDRIQLSLLRDGHSAL